MEAHLLPALYDAVTLARLGSVGAAAKQLHKTPSAVSQQIRRIEEHFRLNLFERAGRGVRLTAAGEAALAPVTRLFDEAGSVFTLLGSLSGKTPATVRVAVSDYLGKVLLIPVLRELSPAALRFEITTVPSPEGLRLVETGAVDFAVITAGRPRENLEARDLFVQPFLWIAPAGKKRRLEDRLVSEPVLRLAPGSEGRRVLDELLERMRIVPASTIDVPSVSLLVSYAAGGVGVGLAPAAALFDLPAGKIRPYPAKLPPFPVRLVSRAGYRPPEAVQNVIGRLMAEGRRAAGKIARLKQAGA